MLVSLAMPAVALAHDQPETKQSRWIMADWMMDTFFIFSGLAVVAFLAAWKAGHFHEIDSRIRFLTKRLESAEVVAFLAAWKAGHFQELDKMGAIPLLVHEEDYYTPEWAYDEEEWADGDA